MRGIPSVWRSAAEFEAYANEFRDALHPDSLLSSLTLIFCRPLTVTSSISSARCTPLYSHDCYDHYLRGTPIAARGETRSNDLTDLGESSRGDGDVRFVTLSIRSAPASRRMVRVTRAAHEQCGVMGKHHDSGHNLAYASHRYYHTLGGTRFCRPSIASRCAVNDVCVRGHFFLVGHTTARLTTSPQSHRPGKRSIRAISRSRSAKRNHEGLKLCPSNVVSSLL